jgi:hypothetical protein
MGRQLDPWRFAPLSLHSWRKLSRLGLFTALLAISSLACAIPGLNSDPTPPPNPTPEGDTLFFNATYSVPLEPGSMIPGTRIVFVQAVDDLYEFTIDGLETYRQPGDSLNWRGVVAPGVFGDYRLRLRGDFLGRLQAEGPVELAVLNPAPVEIPPTQTPAAAIHIEGITANYFVPQGARIPGTTLVFEGLQNDLAELSGTVGYPFFAADDSLLWSGKLRDNVYLRYNLRISSLDEEGLGLTGTAELWATK